METIFTVAEFVSIKKLIAVSWNFELSKDIHDKCKGLGKAGNHKCL